jgi:hypothetical protein
MAKRIRDSSLWLVALGLMLASSGLDGVYMARWMPPGVAWLGFVLNTMADVGNLILMYWYGRLRQSPRGSKRYKLAALLLPAELVAVGYSWLLSWRQLRIVLPAVEPEHWRWVAPIVAGFIPLLLAFVGWAQALLAGKLDVPAKVAQERIVSDVQQPPAEPEPEPIDLDWLHFVQNPEVPADEPYPCPHCDKTFATQQAVNAHQRSHNGHKPEEVRV